MGELGLNGEIRPVQQGQARVQAACQHGIEHIMLPVGNKIGALDKAVKTYPVKNIAQAKSVLLELAESRVVS